jgi:hypothetical protein
MQKKIFLLALSMIASNIKSEQKSGARVLELSPTEQVLLHLLHDQNQSNKQELHNIIAKYLHALEISQKNSELNKVNLYEIIDNYQANLELNTNFINSQQELLKKYKRSNTIKNCTLSALSGAVIALLVKYQLESNEMQKLVTFAKSLVPNFPKGPFFRKP